MATYLYIGGNGEEHLVDLYDGGSIPVVKSISDITNLSGGSTKGSYSVPFTVPATKNNKRLFSFPELITNEAFDSQVELDCILESDGTVILDGVARIRETVINGSIEYNITLYDNNSNWINAIKGKTLDELDFSEYDHVFDKDTIDASETVNTNTFFVYGLTNYGLPFGGLSNWKIEDRLPYFRGFQIVKKIFQDAGYRISSTFLNSTFAKSLYITPKSAPIIPQEDVDSNKFRVHKQKSNDNLVLTGSYQNLNFDLDEDDGDNVYFNTDTSDFVLGADSKFISNVTAKMSFSINFTFSKDVIGAGLFSRPENEVILSLTVNGSNVYSRPFVMPKIPSLAIAIESYSNTMTTASFKVNKGDVIRIRANSNHNTSNTRILWEKGTFSNAVFESITEGMDVTIANIMPSHSQLDFISDYKEMFNLYFHTDEINKIVRIESRDDFYNQTAIDMSDKVDKSKPITISHLGDNLQKEIRFQYKDDSKDEYIRDVDDELIGTKDATITNVSARDGRQVKQLKVFSPTYVSRGLIGAPSALIPVLWDSEDGKMPPVRRVDYKTRILFYNGIKELEGGESWNFEGVNRTNYPQFLMEDNDNLNENSLHFSDSPFTHGLYQRFWRNTIDTINKSRVFKMSLYLNAADIQNLDFRIPWYIEDGGDGNYFHIKKLEYDAANIGLVSSELVKVINPVPRVFLTEKKTQLPYIFIPNVEPEQDQFITCVLDNIEHDVIGEGMRVLGGEVVKTGGSNKLPYDG